MTFIFLLILIKHKDASQPLLHAKLHQEKLQQGKTSCSIHFIISVTGSLYVSKKIMENVCIFSTHSYTDI